MSDRGKRRRCNRPRKRTQRRSAPGAPTTTSRVPATAGHISISGFSDGLPNVPTPIPAVALQVAVGPVSTPGVDDTYSGVPLPLRAKLALPPATP
jgi:hypothetical protein